MMIETLGIASFWGEICGVKELSPFVGSSLQSVPEAIEGSVDTPHPATIYTRNYQSSDPMATTRSLNNNLENDSIQQQVFYNNIAASLLLKTYVYSRVSRANLAKIMQTIKKLKPYLSTLSTRSKVRLLVDEYNSTKICCPYSQSSARQTGDA